MKDTHYARPDYVEDAHSDQQDTPKEATKVGWTSSFGYSDELIDSFASSMAAEPNASVRAQLVACLEQATSESLVACSKQATEPSIRNMIEATNRGRKLSDVNMMEKMLLDDDYQFDVRPNVQADCWAIYREGPRVSRRGQRGQKDVWMNSGGSKGSTILPTGEHQQPRLRCRYGKIRRLNGQTLKYLEYTLLPETFSHLPGKLDRHLFQVTPDLSFSSQSLTEQRPGSTGIVGAATGLVEDRMAKRTKRSAGEMVVPARCQQVLHPFIRDVVTKSSRQRLDTHEVLVLLRASDSVACQAMPPRPQCLDDATVANGGFLFRESARGRRNFTGLPKNADRWVNNGGKRSKLWFKIRGTNDVCLLLRRGKIQRDGFATLSYEQFTVTRKVDCSVSRAGRGDTASDLSVDDFSEAGDHMTRVLFHVLPMELQLGGPHLHSASRRTCCALPVGRGGGAKDAKVYPYLAAVVRRGAAPVPAAAAAAAALVVAAAEPASSVPWSLEPAMPQPTRPGLAAAAAWGCQS
jgi:hypothetical protein